MEIHRSAGMSDYYKLAAAKLDKDRYTRLIELCEVDCRTLSDELRWLIDQEWERQRNAGTLIDTRVPYRAEPVPEGE